MTRDSGRAVALNRLTIGMAAAWNYVRKVGEGSDRRCVVNVGEFEARFAVKEAAVG